MKTKLALLMALTMAVFTTAANAQWARFRGEKGHGTGKDANPPVEWSQSKSILWKTDLPGKGASTPMILGEKMYLTAYTGYGEDMGSRENVVYHVLRMNPEDGSIVWHKKLKAPRPVQQWRSWTTAHGFASASPVVTEEAVYTFFGNSGVFALDHEGNQLWHQDVGETVHYWGSGSSPIVYKNVLIVNASVESEALYGLDRKTGEVLWKQDGVIESWVTPVILTANGRDELVISQKEKVRAFDPVSGKQLWHARGIRDYVCPSPVAHDGVVYIIGGRRGNGMAIRGGGSGDVTRSHIVWTIRVGANTPSPALYGGHLYWVGDAGRLAYCVDIETGKVVYRERVDPRAGTVYSSMTAAGGRLYVPNRAGDTYVFAARPDYKLITINKLEADVEEEQSAFNASPVPLGDRLLLRSDAALYCIGM